MCWPGRRWLWWCLLGTLLEPAWPATPILPLAELRPGMTGEGKTVLRGQEISTFTFEILDILEADGFATNLILVKVGGEAIEACGGIAAGMSGSPLYIDGKLIGAVALTTPFSNTRYGYATPIEDMLKVLDLKPPAEQVAHQPVRSLLPAGTPIMVSGLRGRAFDRAAAILGRAGLRAVLSGLPAQSTVPGPKLDDGSAALTEGSAIAASLTTGDVVLTALGTVTYRDGDRILAFGHPFLQRGETSLFMHPGYVYGVVPAVDLPFKIGAPAGSPLGAIVQDRAAGLGGLMGKVARSFELTVVARDETMRRDRTLTVKVVDDPELAPVLAAVCVMQAVDEVMDRLGPGGARVRWRVEADGLEPPLEREDELYSTTDIAGDAVAAPLFAIDALLRNDFQPVTPRRVRVEITSSAERHTVRVIDARCEPEVVRPGGEIRVMVRLRRYRGEVVERELRLRVPDHATGPLVVSVHGRPEGPFSPLSQAALLAAGMSPPASFEELLAALRGVQRGTALVAELLTPDAEAERMRLTDRLLAAPSPDIFSEDPQALPTLETSPGVATRALAREEVVLDRVVQGSWRGAVRVAAEP